MAGEKIAWQTLAQEILEGFGDIVYSVTYREVTGQTQHPVTFAITDTTADTSANMIFLDFTEEEIKRFAATFSGDETADSGFLPTDVNGLSVGAYFSAMPTVGAKIIRGSTEYLIKGVKYLDPAEAILSFWLRA